MEADSNLTSPDKIKAVSYGFSPKAEVLLASFTQNDGQYKINL